MTAHLIWSDSIFHIGNRSITCSSCPIRLYPTFIGFGIIWHEAIIQIARSSCILYAKPYHEFIVFNQWQFTFCIITYSFTKLTWSSITL